MCTGWEFNYSSMCAWVEGRECASKYHLLSHTHTHTHQRRFLCRVECERQNLLRNEVNRDFRLREKIVQEFEEIIKNTMLSTPL
jgi:hypothetical protein